MRALKVASLVATLLLIFSFSTFAEETPPIGATLIRTEYVTRDFDDLNCIGMQVRVETWSLPGGGTVTIEHHAGVVYLVGCTPELT